MSLWDDWKNAELYADFAEQNGIYRRLNDRLAGLANLGHAKRVLDIACGSGATTQRCLRHLPHDAAIVGVDGSHAMIEVASARVIDPRVRFLVARAGAIGAAVKGSFDRLVCNAAFWQLPASDRVLRDLADLAAPGARFVFNLPASRLAAEASEIHPFQVALARAIELRGGAGALARAPVFDRDQLANRLQHAGFVVEHQDRFTYSGRQGELVGLMELPAMIGAVAPDLPPEERAAVIETASRQIDLDQIVEVTWLFYVAVRRG